MIFNLVCLNCNDRKIGNLVGEKNGFLCISVVCRFIGIRCHDILPDEEAVMPANHEVNEMPAEVDGGRYRDWVAQRYFPV